VNLEAQTGRSERVAAGNGQVSKRVRRFNTTSEDVAQAGVKAGAIVVYPG
jgi:hypothetical protein